MKLFNQQFDENGYCGHFDVSKCGTPVLIIDRPNQERIEVYESGEKDDLGYDIRVEYDTRSNLANITTCTLDEIKEAWTETEEDEAI